MAPQILIIGGADTGRAPMAAALLRKLLAERGIAWSVESAGVLGHDDDPAEPEARDALASLGLDLSAHRARSLTDELVAAARILVAVDSGTARVLRLRFPNAAAPIITLGELAGRQRDIPDPFRMQVGAWLNYANEIERLLREGMGRLMELVEPETGDRRPETRRPGDQGADLRTTQHASPESSQFSILTSSFPARLAAVERCERLATLLRDVPAVLEWANARRQLEEDIKAAGAAPAAPTDMAPAYANMLLALLALAPAAPAPAQAELLLAAVGRLREPIDQAALSALAADMTRWTQ
ncbi:MAG: protein tyrosine phosphatase [Chloroflexaceae bacterium]|jgi:protein-tyrosine-phosphatase|nr:protein tyrosine phosphatase [Chloroflexaceae bacterium]